MDIAALPPDLVQFLKAGAVIEYDPSDCEIGAFKLRSLDEVEEIELALSTQGDECISDDPHKGRGHYIVLAIDLLKECEGYDPEGMLVYIPELKQYGNFDCDHESLVVFPGMSWSDFVADPVKYINGAWGPDVEIAESVNPIGRFLHREE